MDTGQFFIVRDYPVICIPGSCPLNAGGAPAILVTTMNDLTDFQNIVPPLRSLLYMHHI